MFSIKYKHLLVVVDDYDYYTITELMEKKSNNFDVSIDIIN